jgi:hypothetical protein
VCLPHELSLALRLRKTVKHPALAHAIDLIESFPNSFPQLLVADKFWRNLCNCALLLLLKIFDKGCNVNMNFRTYASENLAFRVT